ncbi:MazG-like family protein [Rhodopseudomonas sp. P2A-2r]|uniref:MazG-like family protein n=1 Tax=Rhodopseudomonas sp. P2A-2r TaxID=2991972 RepID=UPI0022347B69|nr:MazG-like family protein [Rhodopseudomonas sp. P2A-2r]UZE47934.1 MazG-like family protein [Rhodopseudomonas sp. P2A-2r]
MPTHCELCGEPMPADEQMFKFHGFSGGCPKPPLRQSAGAAAMTFREFSAANLDRCQSPQGFNHPLQGWSTSDWMTATLGELGEAANVVKKLNRYRDGVPGNKVSEAELRDQLRKELGDVFVYLDLLAQSCGFTIADAAAEVFNAKSAEIGYPVQL